MENCTIHGVSITKFTKEQAKELVEKFNEIWIDELIYWYKIDEDIESTSLNSEPKI